MTHTRIPGYVHETHRYLPQRSGTWAGDPTYVYRCDCGLTPEDVRTAEAAARLHAERETAQ